MGLKSRLGTRVGKAWICRTNVPSGAGTTGWSGQLGNVPISNGKYCWQPDFHKRPIPPPLLSAHNHWGMRAGLTRSEGIAGNMEAAVVRCSSRVPNVQCEVGGLVCCRVGSQALASFMFTAPPRGGAGGGLHSPPLIVPQQLLNSFTHSPLDWWPTLELHRQQLQFPH